MPGFDGTGPLGQGPLTGGGFGYCGRGYARGFGRGVRRGRGLGYGRGYGMGRRFWNAPSVNYTLKDELDVLRREKELLEQDIAALENELKTEE
jgi:hypothetical protein